MNAKMRLFTPIQSMLLKSILNFSTFPTLLVKIPSRKINKESKVLTFSSPTNLFIV